MYYVYLIQSKKDNTYYIGYTSDIKKRIAEHNNGKTKSIKHKIPYEVVYIEIYNDSFIARKREIELKNNSFKKKEIIDRVCQKQVPSSSG